MSESEESWDEMNDVRDSDDEESGADEEEMDTSEEVIKTHGEHKLEGNEFYKKKDYRAAVASYTNAIDLALVAFEELDKETDKDAKDELSTTLASYYGNRSAALSMILKHEDVIEDCTQAIKYNSTMVKAYFRKAKAQVTIGKVDEALKTYSLGLCRDPNHAEALKERDQAKDVLRRLELAKSCVIKFGQTRQRSEARQANAQIDLVLAFAPNWKEARLVKCDALICLNRMDEAYSITTSLMRSGMERNGDLLMMRVKCLYNMGEFANAIKHLKQILNGDPDNSIATKEWKRIKNIEKKKTEADDAYKSRDADKAVELYTECLEICTDSVNFRAKLFNNRASAHSTLRNHKECVADCTSAIELDDNYEKAYHRRANSLLILGEPADVESAIRDYEKLLEIVPEEEQRGIQKKIKAAKVQLKRAKRKDFYKILGVQKDATESEIKKSYRKLALKCHPDRHANSSEEEKKAAENTFRDVNHAYEVLSDPKKKKMYDDGVDEQDLDDPHARPRGEGGFGGMGGMGGMDPSVLFNMFMQQQGGMGGGGGGGFHFG